MARKPLSSSEKARRKRLVAKNLKSMSKKEREKVFGPNTRTLMKYGPRGRVAERRMVEEQIASKRTKRHTRKA